MIDYSGSIRILILSGVMFSVLSSCSSGGDFRGAIGASRDSKSDEGQGDDEDDQADEPVQVSGAFLTCAFMDSQNDVIGKAKNDPQGKLDVACGLFKEQVDGTFRRIEDNNLKMQARILTNQGTLVKLEKPAERLPQGSQLQFIVPVPVEHLSGTIHVDYYEPATNRYSSRRKSIPTITEFLARYKYDINSDESVSRFLNKELELGSIDPLDGVEPKDKVNWWEIVVPIVVAAFGPEAEKPASYDNGATVYICDCKKPNQTVKPQPQSPQPQQGSQQTTKPSNGQTNTGSSGQQGNNNTQNSQNEQISSDQIGQGDKKEDFKPVAVKPQRPPHNSGKKPTKPSGPSSPEPQTPTPGPSPSPEPSPAPGPAPGPAPSNGEANGNQGGE